MKPIQNVKLAFRCGEDLEQMLPCDGGKFCDVCNKKVFDFRDKGQEELDRVLKENGSVCGMFTADQMKDEKRHRWFWRKITARVLIALGLSALSKELMAQTQPKDKISKTSPTVKKLEAPVVFGGVGPLPSYKDGGDRGFLKFMEKTLKNPDNIEGRIIVGFTVDTNGKTQNIQVLRGLSKTADKEAIRIVRLAVFNPAVLNGKKVATAYTCPVVFIKKEEEKSK